MFGGETEEVVSVVLVELGDVLLVDGGVGEVGVDLLSEPDAERVLISVHFGGGFDAHVVAIPKVDSLQGLGSVELDVEDALLQFVESVAGDTLLAVEGSV